MIDNVATATDAVEAPYSAVSWPAILAGAAAAAVFSLILVMVGAGIGLASLSPWSSSGSGTTAGVLAIAWSLAVPLFSYGVGGYLAGRLRTQWVGVHSDEVYFRDTAHGVLVWAIGTLVFACLAGSVFSSALSGLTKVGGALTTAAANTAATNLAVANPAANGDWNGYFTDLLFRSQQPLPQPNDEAAKVEVGRIVGRSLAAGQLSDDDKTYVAQLVARRTGLSQSDAEKRIDDIVAKAKDTAQQAKDKAKAAAETARKAGAYAILWAFVSLLLGGLSAAYMATVGGRARDDLPHA